MSILDIDVDLSAEAIRKRHRQLAFFKKRGLFTENTNGAILKPIKNKNDFRESFSFLYKIFLEEGYILPNAKEMRLRIWDCLPNAFHSIAKKDGRIVGIQSEIMDTPWLGLPCDKIYKDEVDRLRKEGLKVAEITNEAVHQDFRRCSISSEFIRLALAFSERREIDVYVVVVNPSHASAYEKMTFKILSDVKNYSTNSNLVDRTVLVGFSMKGYKEFEKVPKPLEAPYNEWKQFLYDDNPFIGNINHYITSYLNFCRYNYSYLLDSITKVTDISEDEFRYYFDCSKNLINYP